MFDFDEELPPSAVQQQQLLLQVSGHRLITRLDEEVPGVVHVHVLLDPVGEVPEEVLPHAERSKVTVPPPPPQQKVRVEQLPV